MLILLSSCEYNEVQAQLAALLELHGTNSGISITSIASFVANTNSETAYKQFCNELYRVGATEDIVREKEDEILEILTSQGMVASSQIDGNGDQDQDQDQDRDQDLAPEMAYKEYCENLHQMGLTEDMIGKDKILEILRSRVVGASSQTGGSSNVGDKGQLLGAGYFLLTYVQPLIFK